MCGIKNYPIYSSNDIMFINIYQQINHDLQEFANCDLGNYIDASSRRRDHHLAYPQILPPMSRHTGSPYQETHPQHSQVMPDCHVFWRAYSKCNFLMTPHVRLSVVVGSYTSMPLSQHFSIHASILNMF